MFENTIKKKREQITSLTFLRYRQTPYRPKRVMSPRQQA